YAIVKLGETSFHLYASKTYLETVSPSEWTFIGYGEIGEHDDTCAKACGCGLKFQNGRRHGDRPAGRKFGQPQLLRRGVHGFVV
ncbi:hypothetical protein ACC706_37500, partial [Rhizobium johnstonii]